MNLKFLAAAGGVLFLCVSGAAWYLKCDNDALREKNERMAERVGSLETANANQKTAIEALRENAERTAQVLVEADREKDRLRARARHLERRAEEALKNVTTVTLADPWPAGVRNALCLRWLAAENRLPAHYDSNGAAPAGNAENDPVARFCAAWDGVTPADTLTWTGVLLDHIGELSIDRNAVKANGE